MSTDLKYVYLFIYLLRHLSVHQLLKYTLLLPQPVATSRIKTEYFQFFNEFFLVENKLALFFYFLSELWEINF